MIALAAVTEEHKTYLKERRKTKAKARVNTHRIRLYKYLESHPCVQCGETDPIVLEFDHIHQSSKTIAISNAVCNGWSWRRIVTEIEKCQVLCANCHRRKTAIQLGWYTPIYQVDKQAVLAQLVERPLYTG